MAYRTLVRPAMFCVVLAAAFGAAAIGCMLPPPPPAEPPDLTGEIDQQEELLRGDRMRLEAAKERLDLLDADLKLLRSSKPRRLWTDKDEQLENDYLDAERECAMIGRTIQRREEHLGDLRTRRAALERMYVDQAERTADQAKPPRTQPPVHEDHVH